MSFAKLSRLLTSLVTRGAPRNAMRNLQWIPLDMLTIAAAYLVGIYGFLASPVIAMRNYFPLIVAAVVVSSVCLYFTGVYRRIWSMTSGHDVIILIQAMAISTLILFATNVLSNNTFYSQATLLGNTLSLTGLIAIRYRSRLLSGISWRWRAVWLQQFPVTMPVTRVLIVGAGEAGQVLAWCLKHRLSQKEQSYRVVGFIDDDAHKTGMFIEGCPILGTRHDIVRLCKALEVDLIAVSLPQISGTDFRDLLKYCELTDARIKLMPDMLALISNRQADMLLRDVQPQDLIGRSPISNRKEVDLTPVANKVTLVTGAAGSIGSELCRQLCSFHTTELILLDNNESELHELHIKLATQFPHVNLTLALADVTRPLAMEAVFETYNPQIVFHAAAYKHVPLLEQHPEEALRVNVGGTLLLAELALNYGVERFVLISTDKAVDPCNAMGASKRVCELVVRAMAQQSQGRTLFTSVRFGNVLGSRGSVLPTFNHQIDKGGPVTVTHEDMTRYFLSIPEAVNLVIHAACMTTNDDIFLLRMGEEVSILELAERMIRLRGLRPYTDIDIKITGIRPGEKLHEQLYSEQETPMDTVHPNIIRLKDGNAHFSSEQFLSRVHAMLNSANKTAAADLFALLQDDNSRDSSNFVSVA